MMRRRLVAGAALALVVTSCSTAPASDPTTAPPTTAPPTTAPPTTAPPTTAPPTTPPPSSTPPSTTSVRASPSITPSVVAAVNPCAGNRAAKAVRVRLKVQHLWFCERERLVRDTPITSGIPGEYTSTPTGRYTIQARTRDTSLTLISGKSYAVKYWIPFDGPLFGFHDSSWQDIPYGSQQYKTDGSHGCVHMPLSSIRFLYRWAEVGTAVRIRA